MKREERLTHADGNGGQRQKVAKEGSTAQQRTLTPDLAKLQSGQQASRTE